MVHSSRKVGSCSTEGDQVWEHDEKWVADNKSKNTWGREEVMLIKVHVNKYSISYP